MSKARKHRFFLYLVLEVLRRIVLILPRQVNLLVARAFGFTAFWLLPKERAKTVRHLKEAFGDEKSDSDLEKIGERVFIHLAQSAIDVLSFPRLNRKRVERLVCLEGGTERLDRALAHGNGVIALTGHIGNWELLASYFRFLGYPGCLVGRRIYYERFDQVLISLRKSALVSTICREESPRQVLAELRANHVVGMSADQDIDSIEGIFVPFFGKLAWTPTGPAKIAWASGAAIVPAFMLHNQNRYRLFMEEPIWPAEGVSKGEAIRIMTEAWSQVVESYIRRYPDQWVWMHRRWKTQEAPNAKPATPQLQGAMS